MGTIIVHCKCGKEFRVSSKYSGRTATCLRCGNELTILAIPAPRERVEDRIDDWLEGSKDEQLIGAIEKQKLGEVRVRLGEGASPAARKGDQSALELAVEGGSLDIVKALVQAGAAVDEDAGEGADEPPSASPSRATPLIRAVRNGTASIAAYLLEQRADPNLGSPLLDAVKQGRIDIARLLIDAGAELDHPELLWHAFEREDLEMFEFLLKSGYSPRREDVSRMLVHDRAAGNVRLMTLLLEAGADPDAVDGTGNTALIRAVTEGNSEIVRLLLKNGADPGCRDAESGRTALETAEELDRDLIADILRKALA